MPESSIPKSPPTAEEAFARYVMARLLVRSDLQPAGRPHTWASSADEGAATGICHTSNVRTD
jgi:hypothetical protein